MRPNEKDAAVISRWRVQSVTMNSASTIHGIPANGGAIISRQFETICRALLRGPDTVQSPGLLLYITGEPHPFGNFACVSDSASQDLTCRAIDALANVHEPSAIVFPGPLPPSLQSLVGKAGFILAEAMPAMAIDIDSMVQPSLPEGFTFAEVTSPDDDPAWCESFAKGYGIPLRVARDFGLRAAEKYLDRGEIHYFAIIQNDQIVSTSVLYLEGGFAGIYCVSTLPANRGTGLAAVATAQPLRQARDLGYRSGILQSSLMGESVYRRLGFQQFGTMPLYVRMPPGMSTAH